MNDHIQAVSNGIVLFMLQLQGVTTLKAMYGSHSVYNELPYVGVFIHTDK